MRNEEVGAQEAVNVRTIMSSNAAKLGFTLNIKDAKALSRIADCGEAEYCVVMGKAICELRSYSSHGGYPVETVEKWQAEFNNVRVLRRLLSWR